MRGLKPSTKKLIGTIVILVWVPIYALLAMRIGISVLSGANPVVELLYYAIAGTVWIIPIGLMIPWMSRQPRPKRASRAVRHLSGLDIGIGLFIGYAPKER